MGNLNMIKERNPLACLTKGCYAGCHTRWHGLESHLLTMELKGSVSSVSLNNFGRQIHHGFETDFMTLTNDIAVQSGIVNLMSADVTLDT